MPIEPIEFSGARYLGVLTDKSKQVLSRLVVQTSDRTFLLELRAQHRNPGDPMALRRPFGISAQQIILMDPEDITTYRFLAGYESRFLRDEELRGLYPLVKGKMDAAFHFQRAARDAAAEEEGPLEKQAGQGGGD